jgi:hypothetical protein
MSCAFGKTPASLDTNPVVRPSSSDGTALRLLGSEGREIGCEECFLELDRYVELELAGRDAEGAVPGLQAHLEGCPACAEEHASLRALLAV